jgi:hypothetical protein
MRQDWSRHSNPDHPANPAYRHRTPDSRPRLLAAAGPDDQPPSGTVLLLFVARGFAALAAARTLPSLYPLVFLTASAAHQQPPRCPPASARQAGQPAVPGTSPGWPPATTSVAPLATPQPDSWSRTAQTAMQRAGFGHESRPGLGRNSRASGGGGPSAAASWCHSAHRRRGRCPWCARCRRSSRRPCANKYSWAPASLIPGRRDRVRRGVDVVTPSEQVDRLGPARPPEHPFSPDAGRCAAQPLRTETGARSYRTIAQSQCRKGGRTSDLGNF